MTKHFLVRIILFSSLFITATSTVVAQQFDSILNELDTKYPQEKVYLHYDKDFYNPGETIWFKAYLTSEGLPSAISKTLYAELVDAKGNILQRKIMPIVHCGASSNFDLPDTISSPNLYIRSYTTWMLNFDSTLLYSKPVYIIPAVVKKSTVVSSFSITFFPEGGDLVNDISSRVGFKANDQDGTPISVSGSIMDNTGKKITTFSSVHDGMGFFTLVPEAGKKYKAIWKDKKGASHETNLPDAKQAGIVLSAENKGNEIDYTITRPENISEDYQSFFVVAQMQQQLVYNARINMSKKTTITAPILTDSVGDGVIQLTIFNAAQQPVAERVLFVNHNNYSFATDLHAVEQNLTKRGHNTLQIDVGGTLLTNMSIAVTDEATNPSKSDNKENIFSQLLLSSDLKGYIYNPAYYFSSDEDSVRQQLDLVMMTNGWRRFNWAKLLAGEFPQITHPVENYLSINGKVFGLSQNLLSGKVLNGILKTKNDGTQFLSMPVDKNGQFKTDGLYFFDTARIFYQFNHDKDKTLTSAASLVFDNSLVKFPPQLLRSQNWQTIATAPDSATIRKNKAMNKLLLDQFFEGNKIKSLSEVVVKSRQKSPQQKMDEEYTSGFFTGGDAMTFSTEGDPFANGSTTILQYLQGKVAGLQISTIGSSSVTWRGSNTDIFLNEVNSDIDAVQNISMSDVAMIKVFRPPFFGAMGGGSGGAIAIYTKKGSSNYGQVKGLDFSLVYGYSAIKEFYSPDYEKTNNPTLNDYRTTLYWNPYLLMDKKTRRITVPFYNSDYCKKIRVVIEGMNEAGQLTREEKVFE